MIDLQLIADAFTANGAAWYVKKGIPGGCKVVGANIDDRRRLLVLTLEHESFPTTEVGEVLTAMDSPEFIGLHEKSFAEVMSVFLTE